MAVTSAIEVTNTYAGFLSVGPCTADDLVIYFYKIVQPLDLKGVNLLHLGMDGPRVNPKFEKELEALLHEKADILVLVLGTCSLHRLQKCDFRGGLTMRDFL